MVPGFSDHAANERTFLAWVRTALAAVGFGLAVERLSGQPASVLTEAALVCAGGAVVLIAYLRMRHLARQIADTRADDAAVEGGNWILLLLVGALGLLLACFAFHVL